MAFLKLSVLLSLLRERRLHSQRVVWSQTFTERSPNIPNICIENTSIHWFQGGMLTRLLSCCLVSRVVPPLNTHKHTHTFQVIIFLYQIPNVLAARLAPTLRTHKKWRDGYPLVQNCCLNNVLIKCIVFIRCCWLCCFSFTPSKLPK